jgi:hypothetical protein
MYRIKLNDPDKIEESIIIHKSITSGQYKKDNEYFIIEAVE